MKASERGQGLVEFALGVALAASAVAGGALLARRMWERARCAHWVFEATHARRAGRHGGGGTGAGVRVTEDPSSVRGEAVCGGAREEVRLPLLDPGQAGSFHAPMALLLALFAIAGFGTWGVLRHWRHLTERQLRLDRCVGEAALGLKASIERVELANARIAEMRTALALVPAPPVQAALRAGLAAAAAAQWAERQRWRARRVTWLASRGCGERGDLAWPLPEPHWRELPPDSLGPRPLIWEPGRPRLLRIQAMCRPRAAAARVEGGGGRPGPEGETRGIRWKAAWIAPSAGGPGLD